MNTSHLLFVSLDKNNICAHLIVMQLSLLDEYLARFGVYVGICICLHDFIK